MSRKKAIGLQNRLEIIIQAMLDFDEEGGHVNFDVTDGKLVVEVAGVCEEDGRFLVQVPDRVEVE